MRAYLRLIILLLFVLATGCTNKSKNVTVGKEVNASDVIPQNEERKKEPQNIEISYSDEVEYGDYVYRIKRKSYGIDKTIMEEYDYEYENIDYSIEVLNNNRELIINVDFEDQVDGLTITDELGPMLLKISFQWKGFTTSPIGYQGSKYVKPYVESISADSFALSFFRYFDYAGIQDEPYARLIDYSFKDSIITLTYRYYEAVGVSPKPNGTIKVIYEVNNDGIVEKEYESMIYEQVEKDHKYIDGNRIEYSKGQVNSKLSRIVQYFLF